MAEEPRIFFRSAIFGLVVAALYWWASGEIAGTILLGAFGMAGVLLTSVLFSSWRSEGGHVRWRPQELLGLETADPAHRVVSEVTRFPSPGLAPLLGGLGLSLALLSLAWGPAFIIVALPLLILAAISWYRAAVREYPGPRPAPETGPGGDRPSDDLPASDTIRAGTPAAAVAVTSEATDREPPRGPDPRLTTGAAAVTIVLAIPLLGVALERLPWIGTKLKRGRG